MLNDWRGDMSLVSYEQFLLGFGMLLGLLGGVIVYRVGQLASSWRRFYRSRWFQPYPGLEERLNTYITHLPPR